MDIKTLRQFSIFKNVEPKALEQFLKTHRSHSYKPGEYLITRFTPNKYIHLLLEGKAEVYLNEDEEPLNIIKSGESMGEISVLDGNPASAYVVALQECKTLSISKEDIADLVHNSHAFTMNLLEVLIERVRKTNIQIDTSIEKRQQMEIKATIDALTGLYNRRWFDEQFDIILSRCENQQKPISFLMIDIDHFKKVNDTYGHAVGDFVLHHMGKLIKDHARERDAAVRYGGEEMALILANTEAEGARHIAERLRSSVEKYDFEYEQDEKLNITISIGCSSFSPTDFQDYDKILLMKNADDALYQAKNSGRNQVVVIN